MNGVHTVRLRLKQLETALMRWDHMIINIQNIAFLVVQRKVNLEQNKPWVIFISKEQVCASRYWYQSFLSHVDFFNLICSFMQ